MLPPSHVENLRSGGAVILTVFSEGTKGRSSSDSLSVIFPSMVDPPASTMFEYSSFRMSMSHFMLEQYTISCRAGIYLVDGALLPGPLFFGANSMLLGLKKISAALNL